jgi:Na+/H+-dicarboxylate symporter
MGFQWESLFRLIRNPREWFLPRPYVAQDHQTIFVNILDGTRKLSDYFIQLITITIIPFLMVVFGFITKSMKRNYLPLIAILVLGLMVTWSVFLLLVG